jgi:predicted O-methyltransferase YrrM
MSWFRVLRSNKKAPEHRPYDEGQAVAAEMARFAARGLDYATALAHLDNTLAGLGQTPYSEDGGTASVHWVLFAALSQNRQPTRILEIGTYDGETTRLLAALFPSAQITTVDLPHDDPRFAKLYDRRDPAERAAFIETQRRHTAGARIELLLTDSFMLPSLLEPGYHLIWVDGGHNYPVVAWDIANAYHLCSDAGVILCDDVLTEPEAGHFNFVSAHSFEVIEYLRHYTPVQVDYFLKRHGSRWSDNPKRRKHIAMIEKHGAARS